VRAPDPGTSLGDLAKVLGGPAGAPTPAGSLTPPPSPADDSGDDDDEPGPDAPLTDEDRRRREQLVLLFRQHQGNVSAVARAMGKARMQIQRWMKRYGIDPTIFKGR
jgi:transcriptional regulator of acetoin/glycerol metabolism